MGISGFLLNFVLPQVVAITIIVIVLKKILDRNLINLAIEQLEAGRLNPTEAQIKNLGAAKFPFIVTTHKKIKDIDRERILKAITKNISGGVTPDFQIDNKIRGGMIIKAGENISDCSLSDRLRRAV
ncbi:MAG: F0F1 ATP synthase subunit delta [Candidatus Omnitrophica bacterium]|nr:F0F1 ATP synthase subunit delta [Candidatus Omnitrophota bacterium]